jgi:DNA (cytosine-5)-methyltransferase 1
MFRLVDLFAGTGAFTLGFSGIAESVFANDIVEASKKIYDLNHSHPLTLKDINQIEPEDIPVHDILTAGFPCQPFSVAGHQEGFKDERSNVFWSLLRIIEYHRPKVVILENVKNLTTHDQGRSFEIIRSSLQDLGYHLVFKVLDTAMLTGIPHHRERIYIVATIEPSPDLEFPYVIKTPINNYFDTEVNEKYYYKESSAIWPLLLSAVTSKDVVYQYRRTYVRANKSDECPTLTANMGSGGHNVPIILDDHGIRKLTPRECFRLQGFPEDYKLPTIADSHLYKLAGNAVSVPVVKLIAERLMGILQ